jgi:hypothetical protein
MTAFLHHQQHTHGVFSSRQLEKRSNEDLSFMFIAGVVDGVKTRLYAAAMKWRHAATASSHDDHAVEAPGC